MEIKALVELAAKGDTVAFGKLVVRYQKVAVTRAFAILNDFHSAQDVAQDAFVVAYRQLGGLEKTASFGPWLLEIVRRQALAANRKPKYRTFDEPIELRSQRELPEWFARHQDVLAAIGELPDHEQEVIILHYLDDLTCRQIANHLQRPIGTVTKQLSRGIQRLQQRLSEATHESK